MHRGLKENLVDPEIAQSRDVALALSTCSCLFEKYGTLTGPQVINNTQYFDGTNTTECQSNPDWRAWTHVNDNGVYLCDSFTRLSDQGAAVIVIHEALHSVGMDDSCATRPVGHVRQVRSTER